jgi:hypothetical protein
MTRLNISLSALCISVLLATGTITGCGGDGDTPPPEQNVKIYLDSVSPGVRSPRGVPDDTVRPAVIDTAATQRIVPLDPATGWLEMHGEGPYPGQWKFDDVTATMEDRAAGGKTSNILTIQAHKVPPEEHLKFYLIRPEGKVEPGTYWIEKSVGSPPYELDASWEHDGRNYRALAGASGNVELKTLGDRATGTFNVKLVPLDNGAPETLTGTFDIKVAK